MPKLGLSKTLLTFANVIAAAIGRFWEDEFDMWQTAGNVWEHET